MTAIVQSIVPPPTAIRDSIGNGPAVIGAFHSALSDLKCLDQIECAAPPALDAPLRNTARIVFWNAERLKYLAPSITMLRATKADAFVLCELDLGMARSGNIHTTAALAQGLVAGYIFAVEFVELGLGDARERRWHRGETNAAGLHGAGFVSRHALRCPRLLHLEKSGRWFDGNFGERRVGGRIAIMAELEVGGHPVLLVSVHYESHTGPRDRLTQTRLLLDNIDRINPGQAVLIGGDFNTNTLERADHESPERVQAVLRDNPLRLDLPMAYEPMFQELHSRGYDWGDCNVMGARTQRTRPDGTPGEPLGRIDWFFSRGLTCSDPAVIPAIDQSGIAISDHDVLAVTIQLR